MQVIKFLGNSATVFDPPPGLVTRYPSAPPGSRAPTLTLTLIGLSVLTLTAFGQVTQLLVDTNPSQGIKYGSVHPQAGIAYTGLFVMQVRPFSSRLTLARTSMVN